MQTEFLILLVMLGSFIFFAVMRFPISISLIIAAILGALSAGFGFPLAKLIEGSFGYLDAIMIIASAMIFMRSIEKSGLLKTLANAIARIFHSKPYLLLAFMTLFIMFAGMITGSSTAAVLTTGAIAFPVLTQLGLDKKRAGAIIAMSAIFGMIAPPVNIPVMIIGQGVDMPYMGFTYPLLWLTIPLAFLSSFIFAGKQIHRIRKESIEKGAGGLLIFSPFILLVILMLLEELRVLDLGMPLIFLLCALCATITGKRFNFFKSSVDAMGDSLGILSILVGVGMFIQVMTMTGVRGFVVGSFVSIPQSVLFITMAIGIPLFGAVSSFGSASVLGVPFLLSFLSGDVIVVTAALSMLAGLGDMVPPTALAGIFAAQVVGEKNYFKIFARSLISVVITIIVCVFVVLYSKNVASLPPWLFWVLSAGFLLILSLLKGKEAPKTA
ncbi:MAG TPA: TRAP transporter large permease subunit [Thermotogota bacterium]|nr:TRAP transporter large permease subunit [Thermotogota bacterium]MDD8052689.1 TRAP transporter large permease subunit [Thermotogota bacterium]HNR62591.1 TRAP transporter large permease subunit [Thermotogota bacterium]HNT94597.1 TRAP transporter large permease subunit [Thermotogota bacterium]HOZ11064.1 TRAP transporter large permease subunit [Thermotogota bacterium]